MTTTTTTTTTTPSPSRSPDELLQRARDFALAAQLAAYPAADTLGVVLDLFEGGAAAGDERAQLSPVVDALRDGRIDDVRADYLELFEHGQGRSSLHETEYGRMRGMSKGNDLADIAGFYRAFGYTFDDAGSEMPDHLAVELEFYALLLMKQAALAARGDGEGVDVVREARLAFLLEHLGRLGVAVSGRREHLEHPLLGGVFRFACALVAGECSSHQVTPAPLDYWAIDDDADPVQCGAGSKLPIVQDN